MIVYIDTSAAMKMLIVEEHSRAVRAFLRNDVSFASSVVVSSMLLHTELFCVGKRRHLETEPIEQLLNRMQLVSITDTQLINAANNSFGLRSADAIHLTVARETEAEAMLVYDQELAAAAQRVGIRALSPR